MTEEGRHNVVSEDRIKMDRGVSLIPESVESVWVGKRDLFAVRELLAHGRPDEAKARLDEILKIKRPRSDRKRPPLLVQFSTDDGVLVARGETTGFNENGLGARVQFYWQDHTASTKASDLAGRPGSVMLICPPSEQYPYPLPAKLLRIEAANTFEKRGAFIALEFTPAIPVDLLEALTDWAEQCARYRATQGV